MMKPVFALLAVALAGAPALAGAQTQAQAQASVRQTALARIARAQGVAADQQVQAAVLAKNAKHEPMDEVRQRDKTWTENVQDPLRKALSTDPCSERLRDLTKDDPMVVEVILMDAQGANVCSSRGTSDYWQGDEPKFQRTFGADKEVFVDEPAFDASSQTYGIQLSVLVQDGKTKIGALTFTLRVRKEDVAKGEAR